MSAKEQKQSAGQPASKSTGGKVSGKSSLEGVHPNQHKITVVMSDKSTFEILTTWGKEGDTLRLDADPKNHQAWQKNAMNLVNFNDARLNKFNQKFGGFGSLVKGNEAKASENNE